MKSPNWRNLAEAIGVTAIVASLLFVGFQLRQDAKIARAEVLGAFVATTISMNQGNYPYADLIMKANRGEEMSEAESYVLEDLANNMALNIQFLNMRGEQVGAIGSGTNELIFAGHLFRNPGLRAAWERNDSNMRAYVDPLRTPGSMSRTYQSGSGAFRDRIKTNLSRLDEMYKE